jgi:threonine aldolase
MTWPRCSSDEPIDLRSDTVTAPTPGMRRAIADAEVGDDVFGEDPTVRALEEHVAGLFGREAALFVPSGIMATQVLLAALCPRGTEVVCEADAHVVAFEAGAAAVIANVQFQTISGDRGRLDPNAVCRTSATGDVPLYRNERDFRRGNHQPWWRRATRDSVRLMALRALADTHQVALHGDGARLFNAIVASGAVPEDYGRVFTAFQRVSLQGIRCACRVGGRR